MDPLARELAAHFRDLMSQVGLAEGGRLLVALSGGPDSLCLAHLLWSLRAQLSLKVVAAHLDHGIRQTSAAESDQVSRLCEAWGMGACPVSRNGLMCPLLPLIGASPWRWQPAALATLSWHV